MAGLALGFRKAGGTIAECRIAFCGVETAPRRIPELEEIIAGSGTTSATLKALSDALEPLESDDYPRSYRAHLAGVLVERALARRRP
jgi:CO/xanthine dehydrogenase FAD-binding subunit